MDYDNNLVTDNESESGLPVYDVDIDDIRPNPHNPNSMTDEKFSYLAENIEEKGFDVPIIVVEDPDDDSDTQYMIIDGEHRWKAAKHLGYDSVPVIIKQSLTEEDYMTETVRRNTIVGTLEEDKVERIIDKLSVNDEEEIARELGMETDDEIDQYIEDEIAESEQEIEDNIEEEIENNDDDSEKEVNMVDNLSTVLNDLMGKYGDTIPQSFMIFAHPDGGVHMMVGMNDELKQNVMKLAKRLKDNKIDANEKLTELIEDEVEDIDYIEDEFFEAEFAVDPYE